MCADHKPASVVTERRALNTNAIPQRNIFKCVCVRMLKVVNIIFISSVGVGGVVVVVGDDRWAYVRTGFIAAFAAFKCINRMHGSACAKCR